MQYTAWIAFDDGTRRDCRTVEARSINVLQKRMTYEARDLLNIHYSREFWADGITVKPLPLVRFDGALQDMARAARSLVQHGKYAAAEKGDMRWPLSPPLDRFHACVQAER